MIELIGELSKAKNSSKAREKRKQISQYGKNWANNGCENAGNAVNAISRGIG